MAGDWIKMRSNLWDDPRVARLCDATDQSEAAIIGALYWLWAAADQHTTEGLMTGLSFRQIDRKTGIPGIAEALSEIGWIEQEQDGIRIARFGEHNGASAKKRAVTARRVAEQRKRTSNAESVTSKKSNAESVTGQQCNAQDVTGSQECNAGSVTESAHQRYLEKEKEKEKEYPPHGDGAFADGDSGHYAPRESFRMHDNFAPGDLSPLLKRAGVPPEFFDQGALVEFITFWKTRPNQETQAGWESKLVGRLIDRHRKQRHGSQASGSGGNQSGGLSLPDRVAIANS